MQAESKHARHKCRGFYPSPKNSPRRSLLSPRSKPRFPDCTLAGLSACRSTQTCRGASPDRPNHLPKSFVPRAVFAHFTASTPEKLLTRMHTRNSRSPPQNKQLFYESSGLFSRQKNALTRAASGGGRAPSQSNENARLRCWPRRGSTVLPVGPAAGPGTC